MELKVAVCDASHADRQYIADMAKDWAAARGHALQLSCFPSAENFLFLYEEKKDYDILLLDIEMEGMDGVTMAKKLREDDDLVQIIFITGYSEYIAEGYEVAALHYLVKPIKEDKLFSVLDRACEKIKKNETVLNLNLGGELVRIPIYQIRYAEVYRNYVTIHGKEAYTLKMTLADLEKQLDDRFYRVGRSMLVNLTEITRVTKTEVKLADGTSLPFPRDAYEGLNRAIIQLK